jgi:hypothetical protein
MGHVHIEVTRQSGGYVVKVYIDSQIEPTTIFGCRESLLPVLRALGRAEREQHAVSSRPEAHMAIGPATITVALPMGDTVTYGRVLTQEVVASAPQSLS